MERTEVRPARDEPPVDEQAQAKLAGGRAAGRWTLPHDRERVAAVGERFEAERGGGLGRRLEVNAAVLARAQTDQAGDDIIEQSAAQHIAAGALAGERSGEVAVLEERRELLLACPGPLAPGGSRACTAGNLRPCALDRGNEVHPHPLAPRLPQGPRGFHERGGGRLAGGGERPAQGPPGGGGVGEPA